MAGERETDSPLRRELRALRELFPVVEVGGDVEECDDCDCETCAYCDALNAAHAQLEVGQVAP